MKKVCKFTFRNGIGRDLIEAAIASAVFSAECVFGKPRVKVSGIAYYLAGNGHLCVIDISTEVGQHVAQVFTGFMMNALGEEKFQVRRIEGTAEVSGRQGS